MGEMSENQAERIYEENRLARTVLVAEKQLAQARESAEEKKNGVVEAKKEIRENATHGVMNMYSSDDFEAMVELSQYMDPVTKGIEDYEEEQRRIARLEKLIRNPYFARIDFLFEGEDEAEQVYIGRTSLTEKRTREMYIYDWRSPIASVFYRYMTGKACYEAPCGRVEGEVLLKRQYEIGNGKLSYFFDTDRNISDELLRQMLSKNASPQMRAIVETIQGEQDVVIRDIGNDLLMVQGVAGSGKTSIALHRAAYLMYEGLQSKLSANSILIISPNAAFEEYIAGVLPELGEENVATAVFEDILVSLLKERHFQSKNEFLEQAVTHGRYEQLAKGSMEFKMSESFRALLERLLLDIPLRLLELPDIYHKGKRVMEKERLREWLCRRPDTPLGMRLEQLEDFVLEEIFGTAPKREDAEERNRIRQVIQNAARIDVIAMYQRLFQDKRYLTTAIESAGKTEADKMPDSAGTACHVRTEADTEASILAGDVGSAMKEETLRAIWKYTRENLAAGQVHYDDAIAAAYLYLRIYGTGEYRNIRQVVIDEAQDYYPLQYEMFRLLFPNAKFTVLGDINQTLAKREDLTLYSQVERILGKKTSSLVTLDKSFRCTSEILNFSLQFIDHRPEITSFNRSGDSPKAAEMANREELLDMILQEEEECRRKGYKTICLLCKNERNAKKLWEDIKGKAEVHLIQDNNIENIQGTFIMPVYLSKGLEFDAVIICDADERNYFDQDDRKLLYVAGTRALHRLSLFCEGKRSPLIAENTP